MARISAPLIVKAPQRSPEWFEARLGNVTGSKAECTMAYANPTIAQMKLAHEIYINSEIDPEYIEEVSEKWPWKFCIDAGIDIPEGAKRAGYRQAIVTERITKLPAELDPYVTKDMIWGQSQEPHARLMYQLRYGHKVEDTPLMLHPEILCGASPDGLVIDIETGELGNLEIKCLKSNNHLYKVMRKSKVPDDYYIQIQMQMWIDNRDWCDFVAYDERVPLDGLNFFCSRVPRDSWYIDNVLEPEVRKFLLECDADERRFYAINKSNKEALEKQKAKAIA